MSLVNGPSTLSLLFSDNILSVPTYQRAYAWEAEHLKNYVADLKSQPQDPSKSYFFGTILLSATGPTGSQRYRIYSVVDGQQRLTTTCLFVSAAYHRLRTLDPSHTPDDEWSRFVRDRTVRKFHTISEDDAFFERLVEGQELGDNDCDTPSKRRLLAAFKFFGSELAPMPPSMVKRLLDVLWNSQILIWAVSSNAEATQIFELQNDRGKRLTNLEAVKSYLMHGIYLAPTETAEQDLTVVQSDFAAIYRHAEILDARFDSPDEDQLLSYHCASYEDWIQIQNDEGWRRPKELIKVLLSRVPSDQRVQWIKNFSQRLARSFATAIQITSARDNGGIPSLGELTALRRTASFWPILLKLWPYDRASDSQNFSASVALMATFAFRSAVAGKRADTGEPELRRLARDFAGDFQELRQTLAAMQTKWNIPKSYEQGLESQEFFEYGGLATYLLWKYENHLRNQQGRRTTQLSWQALMLPSSAAVRYAKDHIEPRDPNNPVLQRLVTWPGEEEPRPFAEVCLNRLGNLVLDTISTGAAKSNRPFVERIAHYTANTQFLSQGEIVSSFARRGQDGALHWDESCIVARQAKLVSFAQTL
jgi:hypothetical protein